MSKAIRERILDATILVSMLWINVAQSEILVLLDQVLFLFFSLSKQHICYVKSIKAI
jgi:hypothetical protein